MDIAKAKPAVDCQCSGLAEGHPLNSSHHSTPEKPLNISISTSFKIEANGRPFVIFSRSRLVNV